MRIAKDWLNMEDTLLLLPQGTPFSLDTFMKALIPYFNRFKFYEFLHKDMKENASFTVLAEYRRRYYLENQYFKKRGRYFDEFRTQAPPPPFAIFLFEYFKDAETFLRMLQNQILFPELITVMYREWEIFQDPGFWNQVLKGWDEYMQSYLISIVMQYYDERAESWVIPYKVTGIPFVETLKRASMHIKEKPPAQVCNGTYEEAVYDWTSIVKTRNPETTLVYEEAFNESAGMGLVESLDRGGLSLTFSLEPLDVR